MKEGKGEGEGEGGNVFGWFVGGEGTCLSRLPGTSQPPSSPEIRTRTVRGALPSIVPTNKRLDRPCCRMNFITESADSDVGRLCVGALPPLARPLRVLHVLPRVDVGAGLTGIACNDETAIKTYPADRAGVAGRTFA